MFVLLLLLSHAGQSLQSKVTHDDELIPYTAHSQGRQNPYLQCVLLLTMASHGVLWILNVG